MATEPRAPTLIEMKVAGAFFALLAGSLAGVFAPIAETAVALEATADKPDFDKLAETESMVAARYRIDALGRSGEVTLAIPHAALAAMGEALAAPEVDVPVPTADPRWAESIQKELNRSTVKLTATLAERLSTLGEIMNLQIGQVIALDATPHTRVQVECNGERMMWCHLGKQDGHYTLRVDCFVDREQEFMDDILAA